MLVVPQLGLVASGAMFPYWLFACCLSGEVAAPIVTVVVDAGESIGFSPSVHFACSLPRQGEAQPCGDEWLDTLCGTPATIFDVAGMGPAAALKALVHELQRLRRRGSPHGKEPASRP